MANEFKHASVGTVLTQSEFEGVGLHVLNSQATGDLVYASSSTQLSRLGITNDRVLISSGGVPAWSATLPAITVSGVLDAQGGIKDSGGTLRIQDAEDANVAIWNDGSTGTGRTLFLLGTEATSGAGNISDSPSITQRAYYRDGSNVLQNWNYTIINNMQTGGAAPKSQVTHSINSVDVLTLENDSGTVSMTSNGDLTMASGKGINLSTSALAAEASNRGQMYYTEGGAGVADKLYCIMKSSEDTYSAVQIAIG